MMHIPYRVTLTIAIPSAQSERGAIAAAKFIGKQGRLDEFVEAESAEHVSVAQPMRQLMLAKPPKPNPPHDS